MVVKKATKPATPVKTASKPGKVSPPDTEGVTVPGFEKIVGRTLLE